MTHIFFELSFEKYFSQEVICETFLRCTGSKELQIVTTDYYWSLPLEEQKKYFAMDFFWDEKGFKTHIKGITFENLEGYGLESVAKCLSANLNTKVIIGDFTDDYEYSRDLFLVYYPTGERRYAVDAACKGYFDVKEYEK